MNPGMIKKMQQMQKEMMNTQKELEETIFSASAGGIINVKAKGTKEIVEIKIDPEAIESKEDIEMLEDTVLTAINNVLDEINKETELKMAKFTSGLGSLGF